MSFASDIKNRLATSDIKNKCCPKTEYDWLLYFYPVGIFISDDIHLVRRFSYLAKRVTGREPLCEELNQRGKTKYKLFLS